MKNAKILLLALLLLPLVFTSITQIMAPDDLLYYEDFEGSPGAWTPSNTDNGSWDFVNNRLNGNGMINHWDDIVLDDMMFNISEYTVVFDINLLSGYGEEQFHFIFNFYSGYAVMELGSTSGYTHYIDQYGGWFDFDYQFPMDKWATVHMIVELGQLELWINGELIVTNMTMNAPLLENIGFGLYSYSSALFDNVHVYNGYHRPETTNDDIIYYDDFASYNLTPYAQIGESDLIWTIENEWLGGFYYSNDSTEIGWLTTTGVENHDDLYTYTIEVDYDIHSAPGDIILLGWRFNSGADVHYIRYSAERNDLQYMAQFNLTDQSTFDVQNLDSDLTWARLFVAVRIENEKQITDIFIQNEDQKPTLIFSFYEYGLTKCGNVGFGIHNQDIQSEVLVYWDNFWIRRGYYPPKIDDKQDDQFYAEDFDVSIDDTFLYQLTTFSGDINEIDLTNWFYDKNAEENLPVALAQGDQLKLIIFDYIDWGFEIEVHKNDNYLGTGINNFIFLPIYGNLSNFMMFDGIPLVEDTDYFRITMTYPDNSTSEDAILEFLWNKQTGVLEKLELLSGTFSPDGSEISAFLFELVDSSTGETNKDTTIPSLSPGWEFISILSIIILIPILSRRKKA